MRWMLACLVFAACEKTGGVETTNGSSAHDESKPTGTRPNIVATLPNDAAVAIDAAPAPVASDAKVIVDAKPARRTPNAALPDDDAFVDKLSFDGPDSPPGDGDMAKGRPAGDLGKQVNDVREGRKDVVIGGGGGRGGRGDGDPRIGTGKGEGADSAGGGKTDATPNGRITVTDKSTKDNTTLTADLVLAKIQSVYMMGIKRCYRNYLKKDATARGKIALSFTVSESGGTIDPHATAFVQEIGDCITGQMGGWRFPIPKDKDGEKTQATFSIGLAVVPD